MRRALLAAGVVAVVAASALVRPGARDAPREPAPPVLEVAGNPAMPAGTGTQPPGASARAKPRSLRGTRPDGGLAVDAAGHFRATMDARRLFDYFLTATGEVSPETLRARIVAEIGRRLPAGPAAAATALLDRYLAYRERVRSLAAQGDGGDLDARLATLVALRREVLGAEVADAFFAQEEARARTLLETRRLAADPALAPEERARRIETAWAALDADLPPETREARAAARLAGALRRAEDELRAAGAGPEAVQALRERLAGPDAAVRLAELDRRRAEWTERVDAYRAARARIAADASLGPAERTAAVERLLDASFTPAERLRVQALDRLAATSSR